MAEAKADPKKWSNLPTDKEIAETAKAVEARGIKAIVVKDKLEALEKLKEIILPGAAVMNGSSTTLIEIGFMDFLNSGNHEWRNLHKEVFSEPDQQKRGDLRRKAVTDADYFVSSVNAIAGTGELVATDASGSRVTAFPFAAKHLILVSGANKITKDLGSALERIGQYAFPLENVRSQKVYGSPSRLGKTVIIQSEMFSGRTTLILVKEPLGLGA
ncbi:MAG: lactate utilization protein [Candidatus Diapherotrites archaeon]|nr:lactate utilization protein [Candidatus Diapherotrites archaeon]